MCAYIALDALLKSFNQRSQSILKSFKNQISYECSHELLAYLAPSSHISLAVCSVLCLSVSTIDKINPVITIANWRYLQVS